jgi:hypothetical protein
MTHCNCSPGTVHVPDPWEGTGTNRTNRTGVEPGGETISWYEGFGALVIVIVPLALFIFLISQ